MYILTFKASRSKYFQTGLKMARSLGGTWDGETMVLNISESMLLSAYERPHKEIERKYKPDAIIPIDHSLGKKPTKPPSGRFWKRFSKN